MRSEDETSLSWVVLRLKYLGVPAVDTSFERIVGPPMWHATIGTGIEEGSEAVSNWNLVQTLHVRAEKFIQLDQAGCHAPRCRFLERLARFCTASACRIPDEHVESLM